MPTKEFPRGFDNLGDYLSHVPGYVRAITESGNAQRIQDFLEDMKDNPKFLDDLYLDHIKKISAYFSTYLQHEKNIHHHLFPRICLLLAECIEKSDKMKSEQTRPYAEVILDNVIKSLGHEAASRRDPNERKKISDVIAVIIPVYESISKKQIPKKSENGQNIKLSDEYQEESDDLFSLFSDKEEAYRKIVPYVHRLVFERDQEALIGFIRKYDNTSDKNEFLTLAQKGALAHLVETAAYRLVTGAPIDTLAYFDLREAAKNLPSLQTGIDRFLPCILEKVEQNALSDEHVYVHAATKVRALQSSEVYKDAREAVERKRLASDDKVRALTDTAKQFLHPIQARAIAGTIIENRDFFRSNISRLECVLSIPNVDDICMALIIGEQRDLGKFVKFARIVSASNLLRFGVVMATGNAVQEIIKGCVNEAATRQDDVFSYLMREINVLGSAYPEIKREIKAAEESEEIQSQQNMLLPSKRNLLKRFTSPTP